VAILLLTSVFLGFLSVVQTGCFNSSIHQSSFINNQSKNFRVGVLGGENGCLY